jgi:hypothetical protein
MTLYHITWTIEVDADTAIEAAREARNIQLDPESNAVVYEVAMRGKYLNQLPLMIDLDNLPTRSRIA